MGDWELSESYNFEGRAIRYGRLGEGEGPPMVVVHGTPWSSFNLRHLIWQLSKEYTVYFFDLLGYGQSCMAEGDVSLGVQNTVLDSLLDPVAVSPWGSPFFRHVNKHEAAFSGLPDYIHEAVVRSYVQTAAFNSLDEATLEGIVSPWTGEQGKSAFYRQFAQADSKYTDEVQALYPTITAPTLILWGREDSWMPLEQGKELHGLIPESVLRVIDDAGHLVIEEKPDELVKEILDFAQA